MHPELDLLHHKPVRVGVQMLQRRLEEHWVLLMG